MQEPTTIVFNNTKESFTLDLKKIIIILNIGFILFFIGITFFSYSNITLFENSLVLNGYFLYMFENGTIFLILYFILALFFSMSRVVSSLSEEDFKIVLSGFMVFCGLFMLVINLLYYIIFVDVKEINVIKLNTKTQENLGKLTNPIVFHKNLGVVKKEPKPIFIRINSNKTIVLAYENRYEKNLEAQVVLNIIEEMVEKEIGVISKSNIQSIFK